MVAPAEHMSIGEVAARTGLSVHTLRWYENEGILPAPPKRGPDGRRVYTEDDIDWLSMCVKFRASGMPVSEIRRYAGLVRQGPGNETERLAVLRQHQDRVRSQLDELARAFDLITHKVSVYESRIAQGTAGDLWSAPVASAACEDAPAS